MSYPTPFQAVKALMNHPDQDQYRYCWDLVGLLSEGWKTFTDVLTLEKSPFSHLTITLFPYKLLLNMLANSYSFGEYINRNIIILCKILPVISWPLLVSSLPFTLPVNIHLGNFTILNLNRIPFSGPSISTPYNKRAERGGSGSDGSRFHPTD